MLKIPTKLLLGLCFLVLVSCANKEPPKPAAESKRSLAGGEVTGSDTRFGGYQWLGIPYAEAPVGDLRWRPPQDKQPWPEPLLAIKHGAACSQSSGGTGGTVNADGGVGGNENCLFLNVYSQQHSVDTEPKKPVMVWVHGGSNTHGSADIYDGSRLAAENGVVVVTINYRLGAFGWFDHPALKIDRDKINNSGNFGTLDIIKSLQWVQENIAAFGGDASNVTLFGESAGAFDTLTLMQSPLAAGLFHRAISESGGLWYTPSREAKNYRDDRRPGSDYSSVEIELILRQQDGSASSRKQARAQVEAMDSAARASYLRGKSQAEFMAAYGFYGVEKPDMPIVFQDGTVISKGDPVARFSNPARYNAVPLIIGSNRDEIKLYYYDDPKYVDKLFGLFPTAKNPQYYDARAEYHSQRWKYTGVDRIAEAIAQGNRRANKAANVWAYRFDWDEQARPMWVKLDKLLGASHGMEIPFVFGFTDTSGLFDPVYSSDNLAGREELSQTIRGFWAQFAATGKPEPELEHGEPLEQEPEQALASKQWPAWQADEGVKYVVFDTLLGDGTSMSTAVVQPDAFVERILADQRLPSLMEKCGVYASLVRKNSKLWPEKAYRSGKPIDCRAYSLQE